MTIKEYLHIEETSFTISNEFLFINHHEGEEFVLNLKTKRKHTNPIILDRTNSLTRLLELPIDKDHKQELTLNGNVVYHEQFKNEPESRFAGLTIRKTSITMNNIAGTLIFSIQKEDDGTYKVQRKENVGDNMRPFGESSMCYQARVRPLGEPDDYIYRMLATQMDYQHMLMGELTHRDNGNHERYILGIDPIDAPIVQRNPLPPVRRFLPDVRPLNGFYDEEVAQRVTETARDHMREMTRQLAERRIEEKEEKNKEVSAIYNQLLLGGARPNRQPPRDIIEEYLDQIKKPFINT